VQPLDLLRKAFLLRIIAIAQDARTATAVETAAVKALPAPAGVAT
jgi:hypothetical protein